VKAVPPKKKSRLSSQAEAVIATNVLLDAVEGKIDERAAGVRLREAIGLQWSFLTSLQYLSGQEAPAALKALPNNWSEEGRQKRHLLGATALAAHIVANFRSDGSMISASHLAAELKGKTVEQWLEEKSEAERKDG
jgi:hypothetical protein